jgi:hypothetical protein
MLSTCFGLGHVKKYPGLSSAPAGRSKTRYDLGLEYDLATGLSTEMFFDNDNLPVFL